MAVAVVAAAEAGMVAVPAVVDSVVEVVMMRRSQVKLPPGGRAVAEAAGQLVPEAAAVAAMAVVVADVAEPADLAEVSQEA